MARSLKIWIPTISILTGILFVGYLIFPGVFYNGPVEFPDPPEGISFETWDDDRLIMRLPQGWTAETEPGKGEVRYYSVAGSAPDSRLGITTDIGGEKFIGCLCRTQLDFDYTRMGRTHLWYTELPQIDYDHLDSTGDIRIVEHRFCFKAAGKQVRVDVHYSSEDSGLPVDLAEYIAKSIRPKF